MHLFESYEHFSNTGNMEWEKRADTHPPVHNSDLLISLFDEREKTTLSKLPN